jgi:hypothetical protein
MPLMTRTLARIFAAALLLRLGAAVLTETHPLFPSFYYTDAQSIDRLAGEKWSAEREGRPFLFNGTQSQLVQVKIQAALYRLVGPRPLAMKLVNTLLGALACAALGAALLPGFGPGPALGAAALCALWPSNVFFTSQNFKEAPTNLLAYLALGGFLALISGKARKTWASSLISIGVVLALTAEGFYRAYLLPIMTAAMLAAIVHMMVRRGQQSRSVLAPLFGATLAALILYAPASRWITATGPQDRNLRAQLIPVSWDDKHRPTSPEGITQFRRFQQEVDRQIAQNKSNREIATQLFPEASFQSWWDVAAFLPKGVFYSLFMPLPGLYAMEGKIGRLMAGLENLILLILSGLGLWGALRGPKTPDRSLLLLFFCAMALGAGLLEPDLGSAARHKLLYLPMLFPFAVEQALRLRS